jgi:hypothetical protein
VTIGSIRVAFESDLDDLQTGVEESIELIESLKDAVDEVSEAVEQIEKSRVEVTTAVDKSEFDAVSKEIEDSSATMAVKTVIDQSPVDQAKDDIENRPAARLEIKIDILAVEKILDVINGFVDKVKESIEAIGSNLLSEVGKSIFKFLGPLGAAFKVTGVLTGSYEKQLHQAADATENLVNLSERFGVTYNAMERIAESASAAGVSMSMLAKAQTTLLQNASKVKIGQVDSENAREAQISFNRLGISLDQLRTLSPDQTLELVASRITAVENASDRAAIAFDLFGKTGAAILPALKGIEQARKDMERFGAETSKVNLKRLEGLDESFDRLSMASKALSGTMLSPLVPIQTGWNNLLADIKGGFNKLLTPLSTGLASALTGWQVFFEVVGRGVNILLRLAGAAAEVAVAFSNAPVLAVGWQALSSAIMDVYALVERLVVVVEAVASSISSALTPAAENFKKFVDISAPAGSVADWGKKLLVAAGYLGSVIVTLGIGQAAVTAFGGASAVSSAKVVAGNLLASLSFSGLMKSAIAAFRFVTIGATGMAAKYVSQMILMGTSTLASFIAPFLAGVASFVTGSAVMATSATVTGYAMAAAWIIGTLGIAAIIVAIIAVIQNFGTLYDYFANFSENAERLFTLDGLAEAAKAVAKAILDAFVGVVKGIGGIVGNIIKAIIGGLTGIKTPESVNAAKADAEEIAAARKREQEAALAREKAIAKVKADISGLGVVSAGLGALGDLTGIEELSDAADNIKNAYDGIAAGPAAVADETDKVIEVVNSARDSLNSAVVDAARFGDAGKEAAIEASDEFKKLQQRFAENKLSPEQFEAEAKRIRDALEQNIGNLDVLTDSDIFDFSKKVADAGKEARAEIAKIGRGQDLGSTFSTDRFFPTSDAIKEAGSKFQKDFEERNKEIAAADAFAASKEQFDRDLGKINADVSFASDIRKALEDAFLTPADMFEKRLKEIAENKSLTDIEKKQAAAMEGRKFVESQFGKTAGESLREKSQAIDVAAAAGAFEPGREAVERRKLAMEKKQAAGLDATAGEQVQSGVDKINDAFGVTGKTMAEIQATLSPKEFEEYQKAIKNNADKVKESLGVEKTGAQKLAESREKLDQAFQDGVITADERDKALKKQKDSLLSSLGISKSPAEDFQAAVDRIKENASALSPDEIAKGLKEAKDKLLSALGIDKSPAQAAAESLQKLNEAFSKGQISQEEFAKGAQKARDTLLQSLGIPLDPVNALRDRMDDLREAFSRGLITQEQFAKGQEEARRSMLPGGEAKSPVAQFREDLDAVNRAVSEGLVSEEEGAARRLNLQADLQENLKPALDNLQQDRRQVGASDVRSREGVDTFFRILQGRDNPSLKAQLEIARNTRLLAQAAQDPDAAPVIAQLSAR